MWHAISHRLNYTGWRFGVYVKNGADAYSIFVPFDVDNGGVPTITMLDVSMIGAYSQDISIRSTSSNGFYVSSSDLPKSDDYVGWSASVYMIWS